MGMQSFRMAVFRRRWRLVAGAGVLVAVSSVAFVLYLAYGQPAAATRARASKVEAGMTRAEVEALLGPGQDIYGPHHLEAGRVFAWGGKDGLVVLVRFDDDGRVVVKFVKDPPVESSLGRLRRWVGLE
jgi:hypothetical protein